jgi:hypothetical protein
VAVHDLAAMCRDHWEFQVKSRQAKAGLDEGATRNGEFAS